MVEFKKSNKEAVTEAEMQAVYKKIVTPHKLGAVIKWDDFYTDSPTVFKKDGIFYRYRSFTFYCLRMLNGYYSGKHRPLLSLTKHL